MAAARIDGLEAGTLVAEFRRVFADPWSLDRTDPTTSADDRRAEEPA